MLNEAPEIKNDELTRTDNPQREAWQQVFQIVSDRPDWFTHHAIKALEEARDRAGCGPS